MNLTVYERKVVEARSEGLSFCEMAEEELAWAVDQILIRGVALYGCTVPESDFLGKFFAEEVTKFLLNFGCSELTLEEILLAMMLNCKNDVRLPNGDFIQPIHSIKIYFHVQMLSEILDNYMLLRHGLNRKIQNQIDGYV